MSLKFKPFLNPEPKALEKASFAANLLEKKPALLTLFFESFISEFENILETNFLFKIDFFTLLFYIMSIPIPKVFIFILINF